MDVVWEILYVVDLEGLEDLSHLIDLFGLFFCCIYFLACLLNLHLIITEPLNPLNLCRK